MKRTLLCILIFILSTTIISAQTTGKIVGSVSAADGAVPGATIVATDNKTGKERTTTSRNDGTFEFSQVEFGEYTVRITAPGYKQFTVPDIKVDAGREYSLNALLEVGQITEEVTVSAGAEQINASNAELSSSVSQQQIVELPLNGRNPLSLLNLIAGANPTTDSINGQRSSSTDYRRDGLNVQDNFIRTGGFVSDQPTVDDTAEFTVTTQNAGVEQGGGSSLIQLVTPRGGSEFHGALYAFNRNSYFAANSSFNKERDIERPFLNRNQFGGSISGPFPFFNFGEGGPMFLKDKAFFFFNYEGFRLAQQVTAGGTTLLPEARDGTYTFVTNTGQTRTINVLSGAGFNTGLTTDQGGVLTVDPIIQSRILANLPTTANGTITGVNFLQATNFLRGNPEERNNITTRLDFEINDENTLNFVYRWNKNIDARTDLATGFSPTANVSQGGPTTFFVGAYRWSPTSNFSNEIRGGFQLSKPFFFGINQPTDFFIGIPLVSNPEATFEDQGRETDYRNIQDNAVYAFGNHSLRFGAQAEFYKITSINNSGTTPVYNITGAGNINTPPLTATQICGTPTCIGGTDLGRANNLRYFLGGIIGSGSRTANLQSIEEGFSFGASVRPLSYDVYSAYVSDQWRVRPNLTLNLGLRYELYTPLHAPTSTYLEPVITDPNNVAASITNPNGELNVIGGNSGNEGDFTIADKNNFAPSISVAYSPQFGSGIFGKILPLGTVLRGGFRISYVNDEYVKAVSTLTAANVGLGSVQTQARDELGRNSVRASLSPRVGFDPLPTFTTLPTIPNLPISFADYNVSRGFVSQVFGVDPKIQLGKIYEWNVGIQREIGFNSVFEVRYVGNMSNDLIRTTDFNEVEIENNGFLADFRLAQGNLAAADAFRAQLAAQGQTAAQINAVAPRSGNFNANVPGSTQLPVISQLAFGGQEFGVASMVTFLERGQVGSAAQTIIINGWRGGVQFQPNPNIFLSEILTNNGKLRYNALQAEVRRRFVNGFSYQVNYTFQKTLGDYLSDTNADQNRQGELQDNDNPRLNYGRVDFDRTHTLNANLIYQLPFGKGKRFLNQGGWVDLIFGGFQFTSIVNLSSGPPLGVLDPRGTSSIAFKSGRQSAKSSLTDDEIKALTGVFNTPNGRYFINPSVLNATIVNTTTGESQSGFDLFQELPAGFVLASVRAASPIGTAPFPGQVFFFNEAGETGNLPRNFINGTPYLNWDAGISKNIRFNETMRLQLRAEAFNVLNYQGSFFASDLNIDSNNFGRITNYYNSPRVLQFGVRFDF